MTLITKAFNTTSISYQPLCDAARGETSSHLQKTVTLLVCLLVQTGARPNKPFNGGKNGILFAIFADYQVLIIMSKLGLSSKNFKTRGDTQESSSA